MSTTATSTARRAKLRVNAPALPTTRHPARLVAGVLVLVLSSMVAVAIYTQIGDRTQVLALARDVEQGNTITAANVKVVDVATSGGVATVSISQRSSIVGKVATTRLQSGALLTGASVTESAGLGAGEARVGAALKTGQYPDGLRAGDSVMLVVRAAPEQVASEPVRGTVSSVDGKDATSDTISASFVVPASTAATVGAAGASGDLVVVELPR